MKSYSKKAYPNYGENVRFTPSRDTQRWVGLTTSLFAEMHNGTSRKDAINIITSGMDKMEKIDFLNWIKFYEENSHKKYAEEKASYEKTAQSKNYYMSDDGIYLPTDSIKREGDESINDNLSSSHKTVDSAMSSSENEIISEQNKKKNLEDHKKKILARLQAVEKLVGSQQGVELFGDEYNGIIQAILTLKGEILSVKKKTSSNNIYKDLIIRKANQLRSHGYSNSYGLLIKVADTLPTPPPPPAPTDNSGIPGVMTTSPVPNEQPSEEEAVKGSLGGVEGFIEGLSDAGIVTEDDVNHAYSHEDEDDFEDEDSSEIEVGEDFDPDFIHVEEDEGDYLPGVTEVLVSEAQDAAANPNSAPATTSAAPVGPAVLADAAPTQEATDNSAIVVNEDAGNEFDSQINKAFENLNVKDIVKKLDDLITIFRAREIPRQLSIIDMMLDTLGLGTYFPSLAEATTKSLESNQYILSRIEDVRSRLHGSLQAPDLKDLSVDQMPSDPETLKVKKDLEEKSQKEKERKRMKKEMEEKSIDESSKDKQNSNIEVKEDMAGPVATTTEMPQTPPPAKPAAQLGT